MTSQNCTCQKGDKQQVPFWGSTNIRGHRTKCSSHSDVTLRIYAPLLKIIKMYQVKRCNSKLLPVNVTKTYGGWAQLHSFLIPTLDAVSNQLHSPGCFITDGAQWHPMNRKRVEPTVGLHVVENRKICCPCRESKHDSSTAHSEV
jgi:hypothetical protein